MMKILNKLIESSRKGLITVYHGDDYGLTSINDRYNLMNQETSNLQEGVGIYFAEDIEVTKAYGSKQIAIQVDKSKLLPSRGYSDDYLEPEQIARMLKAFLDADEDFYYFLSNYLPLGSADDFGYNELLEVGGKLLGSEVRNLQIELCEEVDNELFVTEWLKNTNVHGTYNDELKFYAIMYTESPIKQIS